MRKLVAIPVATSFRGRPIFHANVTGGSTGVTDPGLAATRTTRTTAHGCPLALEPSRTTRTTAHGCPLALEPSRTTRTTARSIQDKEPSRSTVRFLPG